MKHAFSMFRRYFRRTSESGQSVILLALGFVALAGFVGITTDISLMFVRYAQLSRAVDSAAIAAANQMRQDRSNATVQLAARQFIEFYGISPESVIVDTCNTTNGKDPDLCPLEQDKLVRVRAYFRQPTVFLRLLGVEHFDMWVAATSQTAALDVVIVMDVSESMAGQTTYGDWAKVEKLSDTPGTILTTKNYGTIYHPPTGNQIVIDKMTSMGRTASLADVEGFWKTWQKGIDPLPGLLNRPQIEVNNSLTYYSKSSPGVGKDAAGTIVNGAYTGTAIPQFRVDYVDNWFTETRFPGQGYIGNVSDQPRDACRVRFYPSASITPISSYRSVKNPDGTFKSYNTLISEVGLTPKALDGFVPTYNYYGCCNDPDGDKSFDDLVCQPFKQIRQATFGFLDRIDFLRGDRAAFVTYNRTAFLVNPYPYLSTAPTDERERPGAMLDNKPDAYKTLKNLIGVHAEPYFYIMTQPGTSTDPRKAILTTWQKQSIGFDTLTGLPIPLDFGRVKKFPNDPNNNEIFDTGNAANPEAVNYPVYDNCTIQNAGLDTQRTRFPGGLAKASLPSELGNASEYGVDPNWINQSNAGVGKWSIGSPNGSEAFISGTGASRVYKADASYEAWAACRNGNIGAALREANNALLNPNTSRRFGTIWIIVLMSDGGAGASDPVRRNGVKLNEFNPYKPIVTGTAPNTVTTYGVQGQYGSFGLCPFGTPSEPGELITYHNDIFMKAANGSPNSFPQGAVPSCADEDPVNRHTCDFRPLLTLPSHPSYLAYTSASVNPLQDKDYRKAGASGGPAANATVDEVYKWNKDRNNFYDVDIGQKAGAGAYISEPGCDLLYDVEDYARDWADYIAIANIGSATGNTQVPTIFTIGFGIEFTTRFNPDNLTVSYLTDINKSINDPVNAVAAQDNVAGLCSWNVDRCLGEQLLRYIADIGDNNRVDNDYYQDLMYEWYQFTLAPGTDLVADGIVNRAVPRPFGSRDACQTQDVGHTGDSYDINNNGKIMDMVTSDQAGIMVTKRVSDGNEFTNEWGQLRANVSCGNYYYSPNADQLQFIFDDIASRMFTRLSR